ncbi:hypothetical protein CHRY9390_02713 [Chryseobacterium aquaeductus]|uniref:Uncharacterized protein n=1 Tax=Chryseobacterium aquaeductus TaxID=2675056 RepID=A0A9N8QT27_9FLAO|nr:hypothetical protein [Chryseobacterium aquaeductus]CAA7331992.1 hypothetical protein CHRY9390_02713 [Chryseobacterium potabilaquae]CAD7813804.1 hypothetical protein CHRY9390_02713 [Chryseobacterium aquaeductus]
MKKLPKLGCACEKHDLIESEYRKSNVGTDSTEGRMAQVSVIQCRLCQRIWIKYDISFQNSLELGRWYKGIIAKKDVSEMKPENVVEHLENLEWYVCGGEFFGNKEVFGQGKLNLDL